MNSEDLSVITSSIDEWLNTKITEIGGGVLDKPISVMERIAYLVICNGGYLGSDPAIEKYKGQRVGPFVIGLSIIESLELTYYVGMLSGLDLVGLKEFTKIDEFIGNYLVDSINGYGMDIQGSIDTLYIDGKLSIEEFVLIGNYIKSKDGGVVN